MKKILCIMAVVTALSSCQKTLQEVPVDRLTEENFYQTPTDARSAIYSIYDALRSTGYYGMIYLLEQEANTDYANGRGSYAFISEYQGLDGTNIGRVEGVWSQAYRAILRSNIALERIPAIAMDETEKKGLLAEARFLRALVYYDLVRNWGGVPIRTSTTASNDVPRSSVDEVYKLILEDLTAAETDLPATPAVAGRATSWAAKTLLADVYLTRQNWTQARDKAKEVMDGKAYSLVPVTTVADFEKIYGATVTTSSEDIFSLKYSSTGGQGFQYLLYIHAENTQYSPPGFRTIYARQTFPLIANWDAKDLRKEFNIYGQYVNRTTGQIVTLPANEPYQFRKFKDPASVAANASGNDLPLFRYADVLLIYAEAASQAASGPTPEAYQAVNQVRRRAYGADIATANAAVDYAGLSAQAFREAVLQERAYEFMIEGKRWNDMKRLGVDQVKTIVQRAKGKTMKDSHVLWPIPKAELDNNGAINAEDQNPGY
ncbi:RagB/SusD family nutrient uptake outer membrane protein [Siphonobacter sp. BAB-5385]|uniref:RagB/SusD family nutrient uptake outer membrane protein n=1 Tax=Siphonobacter sp. BAB-5385 TaxID=1864822 RepID=UPI000B9EC323|nr:RagB/SusD family nutrient uptake outer membrane protein [Siphonobacter sp. BAB-5385]OZI05799.1 RagB/SusD family nutrient uptake outer membrane protein [Siphonobacter sp. BAB-5385]